MLRALRVRRLVQGWGGEEPRRVGSNFSIRRHRCGGLGRDTRDMIFRINKPITYKDERPDEGRDGWEELKVVSILVCASLQSIRTCAYMED